MNAQITITYNPTTLADFLAAIAALDGKPAAAVKIARPEGEYPECDDPMLVNVLRIVVERGEVSIGTLQHELAIGYRRAVNLLAVVRDGCQFDQFNAAGWLDKLAKETK